jgi:hypothetical protein
MLDRSPVAYFGPKMKRKRPQQPSGPRSERRVAWGAGLAAAFFAGLGLYRLIVPAGPPFAGRRRAAEAAHQLYEQFGPIGPVLPWFGIAILLAFISLAAAKGWGKPVS